MTEESSNNGLVDMLAFFAFTLGAVFVGPLEAALGLALYWLVGTDDDAVTDE